MQICPLKVGPTEVGTDLREVDLSDIKNWEEIDTVGNSISG